MYNIYIFRGLLVQGHATRQSLYNHAVSLEHAVPRTNSAMCLQEEAGDIELLSVYVPTNHIYIGDIFLLQRADVIRTSLSVREGLGKAPLCLVGVSSMRLRLVCERAVLLQRNASLQHCASTQQPASCHAAHLCQTYMVACCGSFQCVSCFLFVPVNVAKDGAAAHRTLVRGAEVLVSVGAGLPARLR